MTASQPATSYKPKAEETRMLDSWLPPSQPTGYKLKEEDTHMLAGCSFRATHRKGC